MKKKSKSLSRVLKKYWTVTVDKEERKIHPFVLEFPMHSISIPNKIRPASSWIGWGNGYIKIPVGHPWYGKPYDQIHKHYDIRVHGGLTYSDWATEAFGITKREAESRKYWMVGFDTAHAGDNCTEWQDVDVMHETIKLCKQAEKAMAKIFVISKKNIKSK